MKSLVKTTWLAFILTTVPVLSHAEDMRELVAGARLRIAGTSIDGPLVGTVILADGNILTLGVKGKPVSVPYREITAIELSVGRRSRGKGALFGAAIGAGAGILWGLTTCGDNCAITRGAAAVIGGGMVAAGGALVGVLVPPSERWQSLPWKQPAGADGWQRSGSCRLQVSMSIRF